MGWLTGAVAVQIGTGKNTLFNIQPEFTISWAKILESVCECAACYPLTQFLTFRQPKNKFCFRFFEKHLKLSLCSERTLTNFLCKLSMPSGMEECKIAAKARGKMFRHQQRGFAFPNCNFTEESFILISPSECDSVPGDQQHHCPPMALGRHH